MWTLLPKAFDLVTGWLDNQQEKSKAKAQAEVALAQAEAEVFKRKALSESDWDLTALNNSESSWKDEYLTLVLSAPIVMCFVPGAEELVRNGFAQLDAVPDWYKAMFAVVVAASFGVRALSKVWKR